MNVIKIKHTIFKTFIAGRCNQIFSNGNNYEDSEIILLVDEDTQEAIEVKVTAVAKFNSIMAAFRIIPYNLFGDFQNEDEALEYFEKIFSTREVDAYRLKMNIENPIAIEDPQLLRLIDIESLKEITQGHSVCNVFEVKLLVGTKAILKIQALPSIDSLKDEHEKLRWLHGKISCPKVIYFNIYQDIQYMIQEKLEGAPLYMFDGFGHSLGKKLKQFHELKQYACEFNRDNTEYILEKIIANIDAVIPQVLLKYPEETKDSIIKFLINKKPENDALIHGDFSLPNILLTESGQYNFIDLGSASISTKYYDFYHLVQSLKRNNKMHELVSILQGYGLKSLDDEIMKWMEMADMVVY